MNSKVISSIIGFIVGLVGLTIFSGSVIFGIIGGIAVAVVLYVVQTKNEKK